MRRKLIFTLVFYSLASGSKLNLHPPNANDPEFHFNTQNGNGDYGKMLAQSGANTLLVIPESL